MQTDSIPFQMWRRNIRVAGYLAGGALVSCLLCLWLASYSVRVVVGSLICGLISCFLSVIQVRTKRCFGFWHTMFSVFAMMIVTRVLGPPAHQRAAIWQFASIYAFVWFGLVFACRRALMRRLEVTNAA